MRFVEISPGHVAVRDGPPPLLVPGAARVRVLACGICGTDIHALHGMVLPRGVSYPVRPGHEVAGIVEEIADEAPGIATGDLVALHPLAPCGVCDDCSGGHDQRCQRVRTLGMQVPGGMAEQVVWPADRMVRVNGLPADQAALLSDAVATAYHALRIAGLEPGGSLCVLGAGGVGTNVAKLAIALDPSVRVAAVVKSEASAARLERLGVHVVVGLDHAGRAIRDAFGQVDAAVDFSGTRAAPAEAFRMLRRGGRLVIGSVVDEPLLIGTTTTGVVSREVTVAGAYVSNMRELREVAELATSGRLDLSDSVSHHYPLTAAIDALNIVQKRPPGLVRMVLEPSGKDDE